MTPDYQRPQQDIPNAYRNPLPDPSPEIPRPLSQWWKSFGSAEMNALVEEALTNNHDIKAATQRIAQAEAQAGSAASAMLPRKFVLPDIRATKRITELAKSRSWDASGSNRLIGIIQAGGSANPILDTWDSRWAAYKSEGIGAKHKKGEDPWEVFVEAAVAGGYTPPHLADIPLLHSVIRWEPESLIEAWRELALLYQQEFHAKNRHEQAREGAVRDCIVRYIRELPKRSGDMVAIKAFFELPKCDRMFLRKLMQTVGGTDTERRRVAPGLVHFYNNLPL